MPFPEDLRLFDVDEKIILNKLVAENTKEYVLNHLRFSADVCIDEDMVDTLNGLYVKIEAISDEEWREMKNYFPCAVPYSDRDFDFIEIEE